MDRADKKFYEAVINITADPAWADIVKDIKAEIYQIQAGSLEATNWDAVCEARGYAKGLARIVNLRDDAIRILQEAESADL